MNEESKDKIAQAAMNSHPDPGATFALLTDANDHFWSGILIQIFNYDETKDIWDQDFEIIHFLSGAFISSQIHWATPEKEGYAIITCVERLQQYLVRPKGFQIYIDHNNLLFIYGIYRTNKINARLRMDRWPVATQSRDQGW